MTVVPFKPEHLDQIKARSIGQHGECPKTVLTAAFTFMKDAEIVAICGAFPFVPGVIHFWGLMSDLVSKYPVAFHKACLKVLSWYEQHEKPRRVQMEVSVAYPLGQRWAESLGFKREGTMKHWMPDGTDAYLYGRCA